MANTSESKAVPPKPADLPGTIRRIVNAHDESGKVVVASDSERGFTVCLTVVALAKGVC